ncbi:MAG TPA: hypothetical protein VEK33_02380 [Terriglobales bacterium]|nr:hypothetical protein [Terriglobales bacterium]
MTDLNFDVRIPHVLVEQMMQGQITCSMLVTMVILYKWSNWHTGKVRAVCASSLHYASQEAYSVRTFSYSLQKLEQMGWITRHTTAGSHKWYPVTIHNYKFVDDAGKIHLLNPKDLTMCGEIEKAHRDEASGETSDEGSDETSDRLESEHESEHEFSNESEHDQEVSELASKLSGHKKQQQERRSLARTKPNDCLWDADQEKAWLKQERHPYWSDELDRGLDITEVDNAGELYLELLPNGQMRREDVVTVAELALRFSKPLIRAVWFWNSIHKNGKLRFSSIRHFANSLNSDSDNNVLAQYRDHNPAECNKCKHLQKCGICHKYQNMTSGRSASDTATYGYIHKACVGLPEYKCGCLDPFVCLCLR